MQKKNGLGPEEVDIPDGSVVGGIAVFFQSIYSILGLLIGGLCVLGGLGLLTNGIAGSSSWTAKVLGIESNISDAPPGVILFIVGIFITWVTKYTVTVRKSNNHKN
ncbi:MAG: hypothetical protein AB1757_30395 [Acidobacteriota bacterium]